LLCNDRSLRVVRLPGDGGVFSFIDCNSADDARRYLQDYAHDPLSLAQLRTILAEDAHGINVWQLDDWEVLDEVAARVSMNRLTIAEELDEPLPPTPQVEASASSSSAAPPPELPRSKKLTYIELKVVWDENGEPVKNVRLVVKTPDGVENYYDTNSDGLVRIDELDEGKCDVRCDLKNARLTDTLNFVAMGEPKPKAGSGDGNGASGSSMMRIAQIDIHKVKKGESIKSLADGIGMSWQDLSKFNWGTDVPTEINKHLRDEVGCTKKTKDGYNYMFDDADNPGLMYLPKKWSEEGLATGKTHYIRVQRIKGGPILRFVLESSSTGHLLPFHPYRVFDLSDNEVASGATNDCGIGTAEVPADGDYFVVPGDGNTYKVSGKIHFGSSKSPLKNTAVEVAPWDCEKMNITTGPDGELEIDEVPEGELVIAYQGKEYHVVVDSDISDGFFFVPGVGGPTPDGTEVNNDAEIAAASASSASTSSASVASTSSEDDSSSASSASEFSSSVAAALSAIDSATEQVASAIDSATASAASAIKPPSPPAGVKPPMNEEKF